MYTECPTCNTVFRVHPEQLKAAAGKVRCGECLAVFDAREYLREDLEDPLASLTGSTEQPVAEDQAELSLDAEPSVEPRPGEAPAAPFPETTEVAAPDPYPALLQPTQRPPSRLGWGLLNLALLLTLAGQYLWFNRAALSQIPALRPAMAALGCRGECAATSVADAFALTSRGVQSHPRYANALLIDATFVNRSNAPQSYPGLELVFTDTEGTPLASRRFAPAEYLGQAPQQPLAPGGEAHVVLELVDPGDLAVGYEFRFF